MLRILLFGNLKISCGIFYYVSYYLYCKGLNLGIYCPGGQVAVVSHSRAESLAISYPTSSAHTYPRTPRQQHQHQQYVKLSEPTSLQMQPASICIILTLGCKSPAASTTQSTAYHGHRRAHQKIRTTRYPDPITISPANHALQTSFPSA